MRPSKQWLPAVLCGLFLVACVWGICQQSGMLLPGWISWQEKILSERSPAITLKDKTLTVTAGKNLVWQSDPAWRVQDALWCDIDHDDANELLLLCWKRGLYGESRPFWIKHDPPLWSQHIFIYEWDSEKIRPVWMASSLNREVVAWHFTPQGRLLLEERTGSTTRWDWLTWGLTCLQEAV